MLTKATLISRNSKNGFDWIEDHVPLGKVYWVDLASIVSLRWGHESRPGESFYYDCICAYDTPEGGYHEYLPLELLQIEANA